MLKAKYFHAYNIRVLENEVNEFLTENSGIEIYKLYDHQGDGEWAVSIYYYDYGKRVPDFELT